MKIKTLAIILSVIMLVSFMGAFTIFAFTGFKINQRENNIDTSQKDTLDNIENIVVSSLSSTVTITPSENNEINVRLHGFISSLNEDQLPTLEAKKVGSNYEIKINYPNSSINFGFEIKILKLDIAVPKSYNQNLVANTTSGKITLSDLNLKDVKITNMSGGISTTGLTANEASFSCSSGNISIKKINCKITQLKSFSGGINVDGSAGDLSIDKTSGDLNATNLVATKIKLSSMSGYNKLTGELGNVTINSTSGDTWLNCAKLDSDIQITSMSGKIALKLPENSQFKLNAKSMSGDINCEFDLDDKSEDNHFISGEVGQSNNTIKINATSGDIDINK